MTHLARLLKPTMLLCVGLIIANMANAMNPCSLDPSFTDGVSGPGIVVTSFTNASNSNAFAVTVDTHGAIVAAGYVILDSSSTQSFAVARYLTTGELDPAFTDGVSGPGEVVVGFGDSGFNEQANAVAIDSNNNVVIAGYTTFDGAEGFAVIRLLSDGTPDTTFSDGSHGPFGAFTSFGNTTAQASALAIQPDGAIVVAGFTLPFGGNNLFAVARYLSDGTLDPSFGVDGLVTTTIGTFATIGGLAIQPDGNIVVGGFSNGIGSEQFTLARYLPDGTLDATFTDGVSTPGIVVTQFGTASLISSIALQPDGDIVAGGITIGSTTSFGLTRYLPDGTLDSSFTDGVSGPGKVVTTFNSAPLSNISGLGIFSDGNIAAGGAVEVGSNAVFALALYLPSGALDPICTGSSFGPGTTVTSISSTCDALALALQTDGKIILAGNAGSFPETFAIVRYLGGSGSVTQPVTITLPKPGQLFRSHFPTFAGTVTPGAPVQVSINGTVIGNTVADSTGYWIITSSVFLGNGTYTVVATTPDPSITSVRFVVRTCCCCHR